MIFIYPEIHESRDGGDAFSAGWWEVEKEVGDYEWETFKNYVRVATPWLLVHVALANACKIGGFRQVRVWMQDNETQITSAYPPSYSP